jgi:hypothetical protein
MNARYVRRSLSGAAAGPVAARAARRIPQPRSPRLSVAWRDAVAVLNAPGRLGAALLLATAGATVCLVNADRPAAVAGGALAIYAGASRLLEPLRAETDQPSRARVLLRAPMGRVLTQHAVVPGAVVFAGALAAVAGCAAVGVLPRDGGAIALLLVAATPAVTLCAALSSRRGGQLPASVMAVTYGDATGTTGLLIVAWIIAFPVLGVALGALPESLVAHDGAAGLPQLLALLLGATAVLAASLGWERYAP